MAKVVLSAAERAVIVQSLEVYAATLKRAANAERDVVVKEIREKSHSTVLNLAAKVSSNELEL